MNKEIIQDTESRLNVLITIVLFFPVILQALFSSSGSDLIKINELILKWGLLIFLAIVNYLVFQWNKKKSSERILEYFNYVIYANLICYAFLILILAFVANGYVSLITIVLYTVSLCGIMSLPVIGILVLLSNNILEILDGGRSIIKFFREKIRK